MTPEEVIKARAMADQAWSTIRQSEIDIRLISQVPALGQLYPYLISAVFNLVVAELIIRKAESENCEVEASK